MRVKAYIDKKLAIKHIGASRHVILKHMAIWMATLGHAAVIYLNDFMDGMILIDYWINGMRRIGVG